MAEICIKVPYTKDRAFLALKKLKKRKFKTHGEREAYKCQICGWWHLTSSKKKFDKRKEREYD